MLNFEGEALPLVVRMSLTQILDRMLQKIIATDSAPTTMFIRLMVGAVFISEGIQKFLFPVRLGAGRFARLASISLVATMFVAIATTKIQLLADNGFWSMLHNSRTDWAMLLGSVFLFFRGGGKWSLDNYIWKQ